MSARITISYERPEELERIILRLVDVIEKPKLQPAKGKYRRAYVRVKSTEQTKE